MFVFLWPWVICSVLRMLLCNCQTCKSTKSAAGRTAWLRHTAFLRRASAKLGILKRKNTELFLTEHQSKDSSGALRCSFLIFSVFCISPMATRQRCLSPFRTHILFVKSHPRCTSVLSSLLFWFALGVCRGRAPNLNKRSGGITTDPPVPGPPKCFAC